MDILILLLGAALAVIALIFGGTKLKAYIVGHNLAADEQKALLARIGISILGLAVGALFLVWGLILLGLNGLAMSPIPYAGFAGALLPGLFLGIFACALAVFLFKEDLADKHHKIVFWSMVGALLLFIICFAGMMDGLLGYLSFPLAKGFSFNGRILITFYALFIIGGAGVTYAICSYMLHKEGYRYNYLENVFYVAFPAGAIGARIWYVVGQWNAEFANRDFWHVFASWEGGLTIIGGAIFGGLAGVIFMKLRRKDIHLLHAMDVIVPAILVAQAIGRWGNFFNAEVYGTATTASSWWFLPQFIIKQMTINGVMRVPLFLIESLTNLFGYFFIRYAIGKGLKKYIVEGDLACFYPIWYGLTRIIMEPMRDPEYIMSGWWSRNNAIVFVAVGVAGLVALHVIDYLKKKKGDAHGKKTTA